MLDVAFGGKVRELRLKKQFSQRKLAEAVAARLKEQGRGFDFTYLSKIENDRLPPPSRDVVIALARVLAADADELLALAGKTPAGFTETLKTNEYARMFLRSTKGMTQEEWKNVAKYLEDLKKRSRS